MKNKEIIRVDQKVPAKLLIPLSLQHTFAMFGASVLVPLLFGIHPGIVLLMNGIGTLLFIFITGKQSPAYLGSSFAFLGPGAIIIANQGGFTYAQGAFITTGLCGCILAGIIYKFGTRWIDICLPPAAMGSVVALIGFELAGLTVTGPTGRANEIGAHIMADGKIVADAGDLTVFLVTLCTAILASIVFRGFFATIPILLAIVAGYVAAALFGQVDFTPIREASLFTLPHFQAPSFSLRASLTMLPAMLVILSEHISHQVVTGNIIGRDLLKKPGLHRTIFADNFSTMLSGFAGGVPTTTYGENIGVMAITKVYSVYVIAGAAICSIAMAFIGPFSALIQSIPGNVIGGVTFLLYGMIGTSGIRLLVDKQVDYSKTKNLILTAVIFVTGLSRVSVSIGGVELKGMVLACMVGIITSLLFHLFDKLHLMNE
ncbi:MAG: uracil permease [Eubacteriales bacterium]|nr:uracil permease [Eubacteriales bacterium]